MPKSQKNTGFSQLKVGIFVLVGLVILGFLIINSTGEINPFADKLKLRARFSSADGLREGAQVQFAGVPIGKVDEIKLLPPDNPEDAKIEAIMSVDSMLDGKPISQRIRTDSTAQLIATSVLANDKIINITPGTPEGSAVSANHVLDSSTSISINQLTQTGNELLQQINKLAIPTNEILNKANQGEGTLGQIINNDDLYRTLDSTLGEAKISMLKIQNVIDRVKSGDGTAGKLLNDPELYNNLNQTVTQLEQISTDLRNGRGTAGKFLSDDSIYNETEATIKDVRKTLNDFKPTIKRLDNISSEFEAIARELNEGKGTAGKLLKDEQLYEEARIAVNRVNGLTAKFDSIINDAQSGKGTLGKLLTDETLYNNANQTLSNVNQLSSESTKLIYDFRQNPKKYLTIKFELF
ncbi:MAG: MlaD family protein [Acidobacteriota bacterium]|jgi:phospholipid/cholesterol/gamma-HCH transport system substrate-binding protein|nr:MlaD family protein [Acidobacteriota bacterium]